ncbi:cytoplasmic tRNA 2-thiolation protein 1-like [Cucumis melo var. makuwa]|uniref:Cytoplasmic tRNA 2-thiolation protein 1-like n=1 Tax=Cucumis melo var. makuwa TaxID=1194695 RepID=A0A5D3DQ85_CUCMM|nr:cytoplasmic tRNA 2-thiolation protein 1-like [Cucumis melo var. makuwa]
MKLFHSLGIRHAISREIHVLTDLNLEKTPQLVELVNDSKDGEACAYLLNAAPEFSGPGTLNVKDLFERANRVVFKLAEKLDYKRYTSPKDIVEGGRGWEVQLERRDSGIANRSGAALDRGVALLKVVKLAMGHNAIDMVGTILLNILRGDIARLSRCTALITAEDGPIPRCKPFKYTYGKKIFNTKNAYRQEEIDEIRTEWAAFVSIFV